LMIKGPYMNLRLTSRTMSKVAFAPKWAVSSHLPLVTDPRLPVGRLLHHCSVGRGSSIVSPTTNRGRETDGHALPRLGLLIVQEGARITIGAALFSVELLAVAALVRPAPCEPPPPPSPATTLPEVMMGIWCSSRCSVASSWAATISCQLGGGLRSSSMPCAKLQLVT
jgi:hypothetical protein